MKLIFVVAFHQKECATAIAPRISDSSHSMILGRTKETRTRLVKGCPCYKEFGDERICVNDDDVLPIKVISVDPSFFTQIDSVDDLKEFKSDKNNMCYLLIFLDKKKDYVYCVSRGMKVHINNRQVKASDIQAALSFVTAQEMNGDGLVCSSCLYKYLLTLGDVFEDRFSDSEKAELIEEYIRDLYVEMAIDLGGGCDEDSLRGDSYTLLIREQIERLGRHRGDWIKRISEIEDREEKSDLIMLLDAYSQLCRLESVFLLQVMTLKDSSDQFVALSLLKFMIELSNHVIDLNNTIREKTEQLRSKGNIPETITKAIAESDRHRKMSEQRFANLSTLLNQMDT